MKLGSRVFSLFAPFNLILLATVILSLNTAFADPWGNLLIKYGALFQDLHKNPELSGEEKETSEKFAEILKALNFSVQKNIGGYGVLGVFQNGAGSSVLLRADMDALPIQEATGLPYQSIKPGIMHACGHDTHMATVLGAAEWLLAHKEQWKGRLIVLGQPAEESMEGSRAIIESEPFKKLGKIKWALAVHNFPLLDSHQIILQEGPILASSTWVKIQVHGISGHGADRIHTVNPHTIASDMHLQFVDLMKMFPSQKAVLSVGKQGTNFGAYNIVPPNVTMELSIRAYDQKIRKKIVSKVEKIVHQTAKRYKTLGNKQPVPAPEIQLIQNVPPVINDPRLVQIIRPALIEAIGKAQVLSGKPMMFSEDFSRFGQEAGIQSAMILLGSRVSGTVTTMVHEPKFVADYARMIENGIKTLTQASLKLFDHL